ncbi:hypothetical protein MSG28_011737 [Choristoneura fumiferana]|uniref:Uncharacterized protein n=1 Tax=Choristoneura fumiferana TaxID=7141 RepID=A0ACC0KML1_CHOFU|nr:hypothetical protein MSG28_011737 [Choristoneura fumiferana]
MLSRFSDVLQSAADVLAPPATRLEDFEYHWKMIINFYQNYDDNSKVHIEDTRIPHHLHQMLQQGGTVGPCLEAVVQRSICLLDALTALAAADRPPGARALALGTGTALLRRTRQPPVNSAHVYRPLQNPASPTEKEEVELLLTLCGLVRKEPGLANIFTTPFVEDKTTLLSIPEDIQNLIPIKSKIQTPKKNPLFEVELPPNPLRNVSIIRTNGDCNSSCSADDNASSKSQKTVYDDNDKFLLIDLLLSYLNSADNQVVLRACEGIMIVSSLPDDDIASLVTTCSPACELIVDKLADKYKAIPANVDPNDIDHLNITWAYVAQDFGDKDYNKFHGYRELTSFFSWLDYCDTLMKECHPTISTHLSRTFRQNFLEGAAEAGLGDAHHALRVTAVLSNFLLLLPRAILSDPVGADYEHYIHDAHRHYQADLHLDDAFDDKDKTCHTCQDVEKECKPDCFTQRLILRSQDLTRNEEEEFDEGPFLRMLFKLLTNMHSQPYQVNLHLTSILSKLALLPHPNLHEYLLNPMLTTAKKTVTLFKTLQELARRLTVEIPRLRNYKKVIENTRQHLMSEDPIYDERRIT